MGVAGVWERCVGAMCVAACVAACGGGVLGCWGAGVLWDCRAVGRRVGYYLLPITHYSLLTTHCLLTTPGACGLRSHLMFRRRACAGARPDASMHPPSHPCAHPHTRVHTPHTRVRKPHTPLASLPHPYTPCTHPYTLLSPHTPLHPLYTPSHTPSGALRRLDVCERRG